MDDDDVRIVFRKAPGGYEVFIEGIRSGACEDDLPDHARVALKCFEDHLDLAALEEADMKTVN